MTAPRTLLLPLALAARAAGGARAQAAPAEKPPASAEARPGRSEKARPQRKVLRLEELTVEGRIQKPQAFFILQRSNLSFEGAEKKESFLPKIQKSCEKDPF